MDCRCGVCHARDLLAQARKEKPAEKHANVHVQNIPADWSDEIVVDLLATCGTVESCKIFREVERTGAKNPYGFVKFATVDEARRAIDKFNHYVRQFVRQFYSLCPDAHFFVGRPRPTPNFCLLYSFGDGDDDGTFPEVPFPFSATHHM